MAAPVATCSETITGRMIAYAPELGEQDEAPLDPRLTAPRGGAVMPGMPASQPGEIVEAEQEEIDPPADSAP
jgi:hypothetical protein